MSTLPSGTITLVSTDIHGSTQILRSVRDEYGDVLSAHRRLVRDAFRQRGGEEIDTQGDAFFYAFRRAQDAVAAAVDAQRALSRYRWPQDVDVTVRMGIHTGEPQLGDEGYHGLDVHRVARMCSAAHGAQVLVSQSTATLVGDDHDEFSFVDLGSFALKDFPRPERLYQLAADGLGAEFPPPRAERVAEPRSPVRRRALLAGAGVALAAAVAVVALLASGGDDPALPGISAGSVGRIDPGRNAFVEEVDVGGSPAGVAAGFGANWTANEVEGTVSRVDGGTKRVRTVATGFHPQSIAVGARAVWIGSPIDRAVLRIDPVLRKVTRRIAAGGDGVAVSGSSVWTTEDRTTAVRISAARGIVRSRIHPDLGARSVAAGGAGVWLLGGLHLLRVNEQLNDVDLSVRLAGNPVAVAVGADAVWATFVDLESGSGMLVRVGETGTVEASAEIGADVGAVALGSGSVWVASLSDRSVVKVDAETMDIVARIRVGALPTGIAVTRDGVWVAAA